MRYFLDFGAANAGGAPTWTLYKRADTLADLAQPVIGEVGSGQYYFDVDWDTLTATSITFKAELGGIESSDVISAPNVELAGATIASAGVSTLTGYQTVGPIIARAGVQCGILGLNPAQVAAYDPFASTDPNVLQMIQLLDTLGLELVEDLREHLTREFTLTTAGGALAYALPADFVEVLDQTGWDRTSTRELVGPVTSREVQAIKAWGGPLTLGTHYRIQGNRLTFPVDPGDGKEVAFEYVSRYWVQTAASGTGPDADHVTAATDYVLFDPMLVVLGLKLKFLTEKGFDTAVSFADFRRRLDYAKGKNRGGRVLSLGGHSFGGERFIDESNLPLTIGGI
jgi:hypothetical protein